MRLKLVLLLSLALGGPAFATDGILEINQTCAVETGCFELNVLQHRLGEIQTLFTLVGSGHALPAVDSGPRPAKRPSV